MRIRISHLIAYRYETPATSVIQMLRLTPRNHDGQYVARWRIDVSTDCRLDQHEDAFGNITHVFTAEGPFSELAVAVEGEVETRDTQGVVRGVVERFPPSLYLRTTALTTPDPNIAGFAAANRDVAGGDILDLLHRMLARLQGYDPRSRCPSRCNHSRAGLFSQTRRGSGLRPCLHHRRAQPRCSCALCRRLFPPRRRGERARGRPRVGGSFRARARLGRIRCGQWALRHRRPRAGRRRAR